ncbi:MAG: succinate dehydrogenase, cytochrome b556 subunit [Pseudomonadales bacterium]|nr:succinate dehydrogenase, cytochrome b556 subunit [Pseudomonadales bacterium]
MAESRPVNLNLMTIRFPVMAVVSILHRISGVLLFFGVGYLLYLLHTALASEEGFAVAGAMLDAPIHKSGLTAVLALVGYHLVAGIRHLFMDLHVGDNLPFGRVCAWLTLIASGVLAGAAYAWIWVL